jgi:hypothetical protein
LDRRSSIKLVGAQLTPYLSLTPSSSSSCSGDGQAAEQRKRSRSSSSITTTTCLSSSQHPATRARCPPLSLPTRPRWHAVSSSTFFAARPLLHSLLGSSSSSRPRACACAPSERLPIPARPRPTPSLAGPPMAPMTAATNLL